VTHLDTSFVVDFLREASRGEEGPATTLLTSLPPEELAISVFVLCELLAGAALASRSDEEHQKVRRFTATLRIAYPDEAFANQYARIVSTLKRAGRNPRAMDLLIATAAVRANARLVTRDRNDFLGVAGLDLISY
jgi:predicted nucleic acid-binding protein